MEKAIQATTSATSILVVDDNAENLSVLVALLQPFYQVLAAKSGERALQLAASTPKPDLILLDVMMPELDGYGVISKLKADAHTRDIPVIFITALDRDEDEQRGLDLGAVDYITKPLRQAIVLSRVQTQLQLKRSRDWLQNQNAFLEAEVARRAADIELILTSAGEGIFGTDLNGVITFINASAAAMLGYEREALLGSRAHAAIHHSWPGGHPCPPEDCPICAVSASGQTIRNKEDLLWRQDGRPLPVEMSCLPMHRKGSLVGTVVTFTDISERKRYLAELEHKSNHDELTGVPNRNLLGDRLTHAIERCAQERRELAVMLLKLDRFKEINDTLGRDVGDNVLQSVVKLLADFSPQIDTLARVAGDEFVILCESGETGSMALAQSILERMAQPLLIGGRPCFVSPEMGIALYPKDGEDRESLLRNAAAAMYKAKALGQNGIRFYTQDMNARSLERLELESELRWALERDELVLFYQPQVSLHDGSIIGCEALIRWQHPRRGLVPPGEFIPIAEMSGLIVPIGEWVLRTACSQNKVWHDAGFSDLVMAVNMSAQQFVVQDVVAMVQTILRDTHLKPTALELELTESAVMADADAFIQATKNLKALNVLLSIDDFGTGFSSLSHLNRLALDRLKIDRSFVCDITRDPNSAAIARAIISMARSLKLSVIAEGVETEAQLNVLRKAGCDDMQGYYFSKPVPAFEFEKLLRSRHKLKLPVMTQPSEKTVLLVDDEPGILASLKRVLRRDGYQILSANSAEEGLEQLASVDVAVVIADARMPQMAGADFLGMVRSMHPDVIRIMLSGNTDLTIVTDAVNKGELFKFLTKPWNDNEVLETVREAFREYDKRRADKPVLPHAESARYRT